MDTVAKTKRSRGYIAKWIVDRTRPLGAGQTATGEYDNLE